MIPSSLIHTSLYATTGVAGPFYSGNLLKWTNYAIGYKSRFFVLENGILSYYKSEEDFPLSCRGSISMRIANILLTEEDDKSRFDVVGKGSVRYSLKARSPADAKKWIWAVMESKRWMEDRDKSNQSRRNSVARETHLEHPIISVTPSSKKEKTPDPPQIKSRTSSSDSDDSTHEAFEKNEIAPLILLLKTHIQTQEGAIQLLFQALEALPDPQTYKEFQKAMELSIASMSATLNQLQEKTDEREKYLSKQCMIESEGKKRWEEVLYKVMGMQSNADEFSSAVETAQAHKKSNDWSRLDEDEVFYDATDATDGEEGGFIEQVFGFQPLKKEEGTLPRKVERNAPKIMEPALHGSVSYQEVCQVSKGHSGCTHHRKVLPLDLSKKKPTLNVWSFLKSAIGKDLSKVTLPVFFNEPLSMLQRMCEDLEYIELLSIASNVGRDHYMSIPILDGLMESHLQKSKLSLMSIREKSDEEASLLRIMFVGAFAMSNYASTVGRTGKPFNPLLVIM
jgi:hypothetical protein